MDNRSLFLQDSSAAPDTIVGEVFNFLRYLKIKDSGIDIEDWIDSNELCGAMVTSEGFITIDQLISVRPL